MERKNRTLQVVDLFAGCGGLSLGLQRAGAKQNVQIETLKAIDSWQSACDTYEANLKEKATCAEITTELVDKLGKETGKIDLLIGGPPCQGFSSVGKRALDDPRNKLVKTYMYAVKVLQPECFVMENVSGFVNMQKGQVFEDVVNYAEKLGYKVQAGMLLSSAYGVAQHRRRCFLVGTSKQSTFKFPLGYSSYVRPKNSKLTVDIQVEHVVNSKLVSFNTATSDLPSLKAGETGTSYVSPSRNPYQRKLRGRTKILTEHVAKNHNTKLLELIKYIPEGKSAHDIEVKGKIPVNLRPTSGFANTYARIHGDKPAPTITRNFATPSGANCIHPRDNRALTLREAARCQSFPDSYIFKGTPAEKNLQVGNAVPPFMSQTLMTEVIENGFV